MEKVALTHTASQGASRKAVIVGLIILAIGSAWTGTGPRVGAAAATSGRLTVFAAASLADAFTLLGSVLEQRNPGLHVTMNLAGSQQLAQQIDQGARADVFASADQRFVTVDWRVSFVGGRPRVTARLPYSRGRFFDRSGSSSTLALAGQTDPDIGARGRPAGCSNRTQVAVPPEAPSRYAPDATRD